MVKLTKKQVLHVAKLSNLTLTDAEIKKLTPQLSEIIKFIGNLNEVDTENIEPTNQTTGLTNVFREDVVKPETGLTQDRALSGSDSTYNGYFKVSAILSERTSE